jgi:hypothetical protein
MEKKIESVNWQFIEPVLLSREMHVRRTDAVAIEPNLFSCTE